MKFVKIPRAIFEFGLKPMDIMVYCGIKSFCNRRNETIVKANTVAMRIGVSRNRIYEVSTRLENVGLLKKTNRKQGYGKLSNFIGANAYQLAKITGKWIKLDCNVFSYDLTAAQFATYLYIISCANKKGKSFPSYTQIKNSVGISLSTAIKSVEVLADFGLIDVNKVMRVIGRWGHNNYCLQEVFIKVVGYIRKRALQRFSQMLCKALLILIECIYNAFKTLYNSRISHLNIKIKTNFLNRHRFYRRV